MSFIAWHPIFKLPLPERHRFPMLKYELLHDQLLYQGIVEEADFYQPDLLGTIFLRGVHSESYWRKLLALDLNAKEVRRVGFPLSKELIERELRIAQGTLMVAKRALTTGIGFNIAGGTHHAGSNWGEGFCLLNDQAIASHFLLENHDIEQILIIDLDVHQGNGTAEIFGNERRVFTFSMHGEKNFPFKKEKSDLDIGLANGTNGQEYLFVLEKELDYLFKKVQPNFVFYQAGADVLETDKMGKLKLTKGDCKERDRIVFDYCKTLEIPVQVSMGGGYSKIIGNIVDVHSQTFNEGISAVLY